jgi:hypothetical protein
VKDALRRRARRAMAASRAESVAPEHVKRPGRLRLRTRTSETA